MVSSSININLVEIELVNSVDELKTILNKEELYKEITNEKVQTADNIIPDFKTTTYFKGIIDGEVAGIMAFQEIMPHTYLGHMGFYNKYRGFGAYACGKQMLAHLNRIISPSTIMGITPQNKQNAVNYALKLGFHVAGILRDSVDYQGKLINQIITQINI